MPVTVNAPSVPTEVMLVCAAVVNVPATLVTLTLPAVILPVAEISPLTLRPSSIVTKVESSLEILLITRLIASRLPAEILPVTLTLPAEILPV